MAPINNLSNSRCINNYSSLRASIHNLSISRSQAIIGSHQQFVNQLAHQQLFILTRVHQQFVHQPFSSNYRVPSTICQSAGASTIIHPYTCPSTICPSAVLKQLSGPINNLSISRHINNYSFLCTSINNLYWQNPIHNLSIWCSQAVIVAPITICQTAGASTIIHPYARPSTVCPSAVPSIIMHPLSACMPDDLSTSINNYPSAVSSTHSSLLCVYALHDQQLFISPFYEEKPILPERSRELKLQLLLFCFSSWSISCLMCLQGSRHFGIQPRRSCQAIAWKIHFLFQSKMKAASLILEPLRSLHVDFLGTQSEQESPMVRLASGTIFILNQGTR